MVFLVIVLILIAIIVLMYNRLIKVKNNVENAFHDIDVQLKVRFNLVDNLVNTVKGYAKHESDTLQNVTEARTKYLNAQNKWDKMQADNMLTWALKSLFAVAESYPDLKANQNFLQLQTELSDLENKIASTRRYFNSAIKEYDNALETFPGNVLAGIFGMKKEKDYFEVTNEEEKAVPKVSFDTNDKPATPTAEKKETHKPAETKEHKASDKKE